METLDLSRRSFLVVSVTAGAGLVLGCALDASAAPQPSPRVFNAFISIHADGRVSLVIPQVEMGQGVYTSLPMLIAEELEVGLDQVDVVHAPPNEKLYGNALLGGLQLTGSSNSIRAFHEPLRRAGAAARTMLVSAAARRWHVDPTTCTARHGVVSHTASGRSLRYGDLAAEAALLPMPGQVALKDPAQHRLVGMPTKRLDSADKVNGRALYAMDVRLPGLRIAAVAACPAAGGRLSKLDDSKALAIAGVRQIVRLDDAVAVIGDHTWAAKKGLAALAIEWDDGPVGKTGSDDVSQGLTEAIQHAGGIALKRGEGSRPLEDAGGRIEALYEVPFLAHATMEPMNCTAHVRADLCEVWCGSQALGRARDAAARASGLPVEKVLMHNHLLGGGFGRRLEADYVEQAVRIARQVEGPVKVIWSREEDMQHDYFRPNYKSLLRARVDAAGRPIAWAHRIAGPSLFARYAPPFYRDRVDPDGVDAAVELPYEIADAQVEFTRYEEPVVNTGFWRGVGCAHNCFVIESFIDELAHQAQADPLAFRLSMLKGNPRASAVLQIAAREAGWGAMAQVSDRGLGISLLYSGWNTYVAQVADVEVRPSGEVKVHRVVCAVDCGFVVNPDTVRAQMEGGIVFGLSAALWGAITVKNGRVQQSNFHDYRVMRMNEAPVIDVHIVRNAEKPGGIGETGTACVAPAVANAIFAVTGQRHRSLPLQGRNS